MKTISINKIFPFIIIFCLLQLNISCSKTSKSNEQKVTLLNVSYDPTRELYKDFNRAFIRYWKNKTGMEVKVNQSHGGSGKQARSVIDGLDADVVTLALAYDIEEISKAGLIDNNWQNEYSHLSSPYTSTIVFLVRKGNQKKIKDWDDLARSDISVITPNPKTSGGARWNYLAAWAYAKRRFDNDEKEIKDFISKILKNVPVFNIGARGSANTFIQNKTGDVLIAWENEALLVTQEAVKNDYEIIYPSLSILAQPPIAVVDKIVDKKETREVAKAYLKYLYSDEGQNLIAWHYYRPINIKILNKYRDQFPLIELKNINWEFDGWQKAQKVHFSDGGTFDQIYSKIKK